MFVLSGILTFIGVIALIGAVGSIFLIFMEDARMFGFIGLLAGLVIAAGCIGGSIGIYRSTQQIETIHVKSKERIAEDKSGRYLIYTDNETFENTDSWAYGKFNSSDMYGNIYGDKNYSCKVAGWRVPFWSSYRNLIECSEVK